MGVLRYFDEHDPNSRLDYQIKWSTWLGTDQITGSSWAADTANPSGMTLETSSFTTGTTTVWLSSGTAGSSYRFENTIGTLQGRTAQESIFVTVKDK